MIVYNLICKTCSTEFEGWFDNSIDFENQKRKKMINCPSCNSFEIKKYLMAPNLVKKTNSKKDSKIKKTMINKIKKYKKIIENFTEEAKQMKYGEKEERPIYGEATLEQTKELAEEEIEVVPLPWTPEKKTN